MTIGICKICNNESHMQDMQKYALKVIFMII